MRYIVAFLFLGCVEQVELSGGAYTVHSTTPTEVEFLNAVIDELYPVHFHNTRVEVRQHQESVIREYQSGYPQPPAHRCLSGFAVGARLAIGVPDAIAHELLHVWAMKSLPPMTQEEMHDATLQIEREVRAKTSHLSPYKTIWMPQCEP